MPNPVTTATLRALMALAATFLASLAAAEPASRPNPDAEGFAPANGVDLRWHSYGTGPPLLVLNGGPGVSSTHFANLAVELAALGNGHRVILFDQRGTGGSQLARVDEDTVTLAAMVADIESLRRHLGIKRWAVLGHSWGGMYGMLYATRHSAQVERLVLSASGGATLDWLGYVGANIRKHMGPERRTEYERWLDPPDGTDPDVANQHRVEAMAAAYVFNPENIPFVVAALTREGANFPRVRGLVYADLERTRYNLLDELATLPTPTLILHGRQDLLGEAVPLQTHAALRVSELVWLEECAHYPWLDAPAAYFGAIERFLAARAVAERPDTQ